jgi:hypothetical protein
MKTLKTMALIGASALAVSAFSTAAVQAQPYGGYRAGYDHQRFDSRLSTANIDRLTERVKDAARERVITWNTAYHLEQDLKAVRPIAWRAQNGRASAWEIQRLNNTVAQVEAQSRRYASNDRRYNGHDWRR